MASTSETALETTLNDLANARLRDKAPALVNYMVGFQLLKANEEGNRAVGIFGFEIDDAMYYCPVFFLNGEVKGLDSLYSVDSDLFMPLTEEWINTLIHRKAQKLGEPDSKSTHERGVRFPDYRRLTQLPPSNAKSAALETIESRMLDFPELTDVAPSLPVLARETGLSGQIVEAMRSNAKLASAIGTFYDALDFIDAPKVAEAKKKVIIIGGFTDEGVEDLTDDQRRDVLKGGIAVVDERPSKDHSMVWPTNTKLEFSSPGTNGLYDVVMADGSLEAALCYRMSGPDLGTCTNNLLLVTKSKVGLVPYRSVSVMREYSRQEREDFLNKAGVAPESLSVGDTVSFLSRTGEISIPVTIEGITNGSDDFKVYTVRPTSALYRGYGSSKVATHMTWEPSVRDVPVAIDSYDKPGLKHRGSPVERIHQVVVRKGDNTRLAYALDKIIVSEKGFRAIKLGRNGEWSDNIDVSDLGDAKTVEIATTKIAQDIKVWSSGDGLLNIRDEGPAKGYSKIAAVTHLVCGLGMSGEDALGIVKSAGITPVGYWVKKSADLQSFPELNDRSETGFMSQFHPQTQPYETKNVTPSPDNSRFYDYKSPFGGGGDGEQPNDTLSTVENASELGSKEVFDAAALMSIVKSSRPTELVERYMPAIIAGMDRLGRLLFAAFWHYDEYKERFGDELPDLIDNLRSTFEHLGDIVTQVKQRSLSGDADYFGVGMLDG